MSWARLLVVWISMAIAMSANGIFRETVLQTFLRSSAANVVSAILGVVTIAVITRIGFRVIAPTATTGSLVVASAVLVLLTVAFECAVGIVVDHRSWADLAGHYAIWRGELWPVVLGFLGATPFWWGRWALRGDRDE